MNVGTFYIHLGYIIIGIGVILSAVVGPLVIHRGNKINKRQDQKEIVKAVQIGHEKTHDLLKEVLALATEAKNNSEVLPGNKITFSKAGGAVILNLSFHGNPLDRRSIFDLGNPQDLKRNRISLFLDKDHQLVAFLRDNDAKQRELSVRHDVIPNRSVEISCFWNKEYGVLAVLIDGQLLGKMRLDELSVAPISGTLQFGQSLSGEQGMDMVLQEVRVYSF